MAGDTLGTTDIGRVLPTAARVGSGHAMKAECSTKAIGMAIVADTATIIDGTATAGIVTMTVITRVF